MPLSNTIDARSMPAETRDKEILKRLAAMQPGQDIVLIAPHEPSRLLRDMLKECPLRYDFAPVEGNTGLWRYQVTVRNPDEPRSINNYLAWDHDRLDSMLSQAIGHVEAGEWESAAVWLRDFRHRLSRHIRIEEEILFPTYEEKTGIREGGPTWVMRHEHVNILGHLDCMVRACEARDEDELKRQQSLLNDVLVEHNEKEEQILYPAVDALFGERELHALVIRLLLG